MSALQRLAACALLVGLASATGLVAQEWLPRRVLIVADTPSLQFRSTPRTRDLMSRTLGVLRRNGDLVGVAVTGSQGIVVPAPAGWGALDSAVTRVRGEAMSPWTVASATATSDDAAEIRRRSATSFSTITGALRAMSSTASSPVIVFFTEGYPSLADESKAFVQEARRVNATVYVIDPRGWSVPERQFDRKEWELYLEATEPGVRALASATNGMIVSPRSGFDAFLVSLETPRSTQ